MPDTGWCLKAGGAATVPRYRPARDGKCRRPSHNPGKPNIPTDTPLSQSENGTPRLRTRARSLGQHPAQRPQKEVRSLMLEKIIKRRLEDTCDAAPTSRAAGERR